MRYDSFAYLWPPRPGSKQAIMPMMASMFERRGWKAQVKKNGTCNVIAVAPGGAITAMNRHNETHKLWSPTPASSAAFQGLPGTGWYVFVAELLHSKVTGGPRDTNYIFDILVADGEYLVGKTFAERQEILNAIFPNSVGETESHRIINDNTWVAKLHDVDFRDLFDGLTADEDEGLVIKDPASKLALCSKELSNQQWQVKVRRPHKNFSW